MRTSAFLISIVLTLGLSVLAEPAPIVEAGQTNLFLDNESAQVHVLVRPQERLILAFPAENSGHGIWFEGEIAVKPESLKALETASSDTSYNAKQRVQIQLEVGRPTVIRKVLMDSLRVLRDRGEGDKTLADKVESVQVRVHGEAALMQQSPHSQGVSYVRREIGLYSPHISPNSRVVVHVDDIIWKKVPSYSTGLPEFALTLSPAQVDAHGQVTLLPGVVTLEATLPFAPLSRFSPEELYRKEYLTNTAPLSPRVVSSRQALEFLTRREKMMAGSWRFLTYFGRDTLISTAMLEPILSDQTLLASVTSVLERLSPEGSVAHEEDIGPFAEWRHLENGKTSLAPIYDYKMIDDDFLLPLLLAKLEESGHTQLLSGLLSNSVTSEPILRNADYVRGKLKGDGLVRLLPGEATGDWRDSHEGLGDGVYPASVNSDLALPALRALEMIERKATPQRPAVARELAKLRAAWGRRAATYWIELSPAEVSSRIEAFGRSLNPDQKVGYEKLVAQSSEYLDKPFRFPVLSFDDRKTPVEVVHSDVAFTLFYGHPDQAQLEDIVTLLERPFPFGLKTPAGYLVANPIFSSNPKHHKSLGFGQYHGIVVWSWPQAMMSLGLMRQHGRFSALDERIAQLARDIRECEERVGPLATSELWAVDLDKSGVTWRGYGVAGDQTESNALQLWSTVYPALEYTRQRSAIWAKP